MNPSCLWNLFPSAEIISMVGVLVTPYFLAQGAGSVQRQLHFDERLQCPDVLALGQGGFDHLLVIVAGRERTDEHHHLLRRGAFAGLGQGRVQVAGPAQLCPAQLKGDYDAGHRHERRGKAELNPPIG